MTTNSSSPVDAGCETCVVNIKKVPDSEFDEYVGRGRGNKHIGNTEVGEHGWLGNPFAVGVDGTREEVVTQFAVVFCRKLLNDEEFKEAVDKLEGQTLGCWCKPEACHGDVLVEYLENGAMSVVERWSL